MFGYGNTSFATDVEAVQQAIYTKLKLFKNEFWEDLDDGLPFFQEIAGTRDKDTIDMLVRNRILETQGVTSIKSFSSQISAEKKYTAAVYVNTIYGTVEVSI